MTDDYIEHYGVPRRSGRYPWGSGERPYQGDPKKAKLYRKAEGIESKSLKKMEKMVSKGRPNEEISDYAWRTNNKLDDIKRKLTRMEHREIAEALGISDRKLQNAVADYEWAKRTAAQYEAEGRSKNKLDVKKISDAGGRWGMAGLPVGFAGSLAGGMSTGFALGAAGGLAGAITGVIVMEATKEKKYTLKGAEYYEKVAKQAEEIFRQKIPDAPKGKDPAYMLKMLEDKKG